MYVFAYVGRPGSGKSHEVVSRVMLPALREGRRVVTNISGLDLPAIAARTGRTVDDNFIAVVNTRDAVDDTDNPIRQPNFFPTKGGTGSFVHPGDLVLIDEAWQFWAKGHKPSPNETQFWRMLRHYVDSQGRSCQLVVMTQDESDLHPFLRKVVDTTFRLTNASKLGLAGRYRVEAFEGAQLHQRKPFSKTRYKYDKTVFPLYKSVEGEVGQNVAVDSRASLWASPLFTTWIPTFACLGAVGIWYAWKFLHPAVDPKAAPPLAPVTQSAQPGGSVAPVPSAGRLHRISGWVEIGNRVLVTIEHPEGFSRAVWYPVAAVVRESDGISVLDHGARVASFEYRAVATAPREHPVAPGAPGESITSAVGGLFK